MTPTLPTRAVTLEPPGSPRATFVTATLLGVLSFAFRVPALLNARSTNSDAAIVGLQAMHILKGEHSAYLWGSGYQTSADSYVAAAFFGVLGPTPFALMLSALALHVFGTYFVFATLLRRAPPWPSLVLTLPLVFAPASIHTYALFPPRQASITLALAALWAIDGAAPANARIDLAKSARWLALGGVLYGLALSADPYPMVLAPVLFGLAVLVSWPKLFGRLAALVGGFALGVAPLVAMRAHGHANDGPLGLSLHVIRHNARVLWDTCLPWALSYRVYTAYDPSHYVPWNAPIGVQALQLTGVLMLAALVISGLGAVRDRTLPWPVRRLGFIGALGWPTTIAAFLVSVMVMDHFSMRYLAVLTLLLPFAALPAARTLRLVRFSAVLAPHLIAAAICGWLGYGPFVHGLRPVVELPEIEDDLTLFSSLKARGIRYAEADYWAAYRLTLLSAESLIVVPNNDREDRYAPYRRDFGAAHEFAYIYDRGRSREDLGDAERQLVADNARVERADIGALTVFVVTRK